MRVNEQGRSMIEMLGVLAIVGVLSVGGIAGYSKAMAKFKANKVIDQVTMISTNIRTLYASQRTYNGLNNVLAKMTNAVPAEMYDVQTDSVITNAFSGHVFITDAYNVATANADQSNDDAYVIAFDSIPQAACVTMATTDWGGDAGSGFAYLKVDGSDTITEVNAANLADDITATASILEDEDNVKYAIPGNGTQPSPMTVLTATAACHSLTNNVFVWKYI